LVKQVGLFAAVGAAVMALAIAAPVSAAELLHNGSFETLGAGAIAEGWGGYTYYTDGTHTGGNVALPDWTVQSGSVDLTNTNSVWGPAADGNYSLDINGWDAGVISQAFDTLAGHTYIVTFDYSRNPAGAPDPATADVFVGANGLHVSAANNAGLFGTGGAMLWQSGSFTFVGTGHDTIQLAATVAGNGGVFFDNVSVSGAVPEPASWALMIGGFGMAGAMMRRRRMVAATA
jgi:hypothetical protein